MSDQGTLVAASRPSIRLTGQFRDETQLPLQDGRYPATIRLYRKTSSRYYFFITSKTVTVKNGTFELILGDFVPLPRSLDGTRPLLALSLTGYGEAAPRRPVAPPATNLGILTVPSRETVSNIRPASPRTAPAAPAVSPTVTLTLPNLPAGILHSTATGVVSAGDVTLGAETSGNYVATLNTGSGLTGATSGEGSNPTLSIDSGVVATLTDTQTVSNKTLSAPRLTGSITLSDLKSCDTLDTNASGLLACGSDASGSSTTSLALSALTAATAATTLAHANNPQTWNFAITTADRVGFTFGESSASTATGIPAILRASTVASSTAIPLYIQNLGSAISLRVDDESSDTSPFVISAAGLVGIGTTSPTALLHVPASTTSNASIRIPAGPAPTSPNEGDIWNDSTQKALVGYVDGINTKYSGVIFASTASKTVTNTTTQTSIVGTGVGTATLPANFLVAGKTLRIRVSGVYSTSGFSGATMRFRVNFGSTAVLDTTARVPNGSVANRRFELVGLVSTRATGSSGTVFGQGVTFVSNDGTAQQAWEMKNTTTATIDTTASQAVDATIAWGTGVDADDTITGTNAIIEVLN